MPHVHSHARVIETRKELYTYLLILFIGLCEIFLEIGIGFVLGDNAINAAGGIHTSGDLIIVILSALTAVTVVAIAPHRPSAEQISRTIMSSLAVSIFLFGGVTIFTISIERMIEPVIGIPWIAIVIGFISILTNYLKFFLLERDGGEAGNITVKSLSRHVKIDMSLGAIACLGGTLRIVSAYFPSTELIALRIDPFLSLLVSLWLFWSAYEIGQEIYEGQIMGRSDHHSHDH